ncbi:MAG: NAD(P)/FAD-dependent oxidoreductase [bacterium]
MADVSSWSQQQSADVCVVGAGPAGSVMAARLAQLGADVVLIERSRFPRRHLGESLSPGVLPLLDTIGIREDEAAAGFRRVRSVLTNWDGALDERVDAREQGRLVDRGQFDAMLVRHATALGVRVFQPATLVARSHDESAWRLELLAGADRVALRAQLLVDATGRSALLRGQRRRTGPRTIALYAYWQGRSLPDRPRIEAGDAAWFWGVPLPDGSYNTLVFVDGESIRDDDRAALHARFHSLLACSGLMDQCDGVEMLGSVHAADATPYLDEDSATFSTLKVGDSALAIDPLSSSGVQKAIQGALSGAIVANTLLRRPASTDAAIQFYRESLAHSSERHRGWAASHYGTVHARNRGDFWAVRSEGATTHEDTPTEAIGARIASNERVALSPALEIVNVPRLGTEFVGLGSALRHPGLDAPVAYLGGWELAPLLRDVRAGMTPLQVVHGWSSRVPFKSGISIAGWLLGHGILVPYTGTQS